MGWDNLPSDAFKLGTSQFNSASKLYHPFNPTFAGANDNITTDVKSFTVERGRLDDSLESLGAGQATLFLKEPNLLSGKYNPRNASSVLFNFLKPNKPIRIRAVHNSITYPIFYGFISNIDYRPENYESVIIAHDAFVLMDAAFPVITEIGNAKTQYLLWLLLEGCDIPETHRFSATGGGGDAVPLFSTDGSVSGLSKVGDLLKAERGNFFFGKDGVAVYNPRATRYSGTAATAMPNGITITPRASVERTKIKNRARVTRTGGVEQEFKDQPSIDQFGPLDAGSFTTDYVWTDEQALSLASSIVNRNKSVVSNVWDASVALNTSDTLMAAGLARELDHLISINETLVVGSFWVDRITHRVDMGGNLHIMDFGLSQAQASDSPFKIGTSTIGGTDTFTWSAV